MSTGALCDDTRLVVHPLHVERDDRGDAHGVGRVDTGVFVEMPSTGLELIAWLEEGLSLGEVKVRFSALRGDEPDVQDFVTTLAELGYVASCDGRAVPEEHADAQRGWQPLVRIQARELASRGRAPSRADADSSRTSVA